MRPLLIDLLCLLAHHAGDVVHKDELLEQVWHHRFVGESSLSKAVAELRQVLGDADRPARFIETVPKRGYRLVAPVWPCPSASHPRVAVLPFDRIAGDSTDDQLADGLAEAVITALSRMPGIRVISRQTVRHLRDSDRPLADIGQELHVEALVTGTLMRDRSRATLSVGLTELLPEERLVWGETFEDEAQALLAAHCQVAERIARAVRAALQPGAPDEASSVALVDPSAHSALVSAQRLMGAWTRDALEAGIRHLTEAVEVDPSYAPAHEGLATCLAALGFWGHVPAVEAYARARESASVALSLDRALSHGHVALAFVHWLHDWDFDGAEQEFLHAMALNPSDELARISYALFLLTVRGDRILALEHADAARAVDPLSESTGSMSAWIYLLASAPERARQQAAATLARHPQSVHARYVRGWLLGGAGDWPAAIDQFGQARKLAADAVSVGFLGHAQGRAGREEPATDALAELTVMARREHVSAISFAFVESGLCHVDRAFEWLHRSCEARESRVFWFGLLPAADPLRTDPRFAALMHRLGVAPQPTS